MTKPPSTNQTHDEPVPDAACCGGVAGDVTVGRSGVAAATGVGSDVTVTDGSAVAGIAEVPLDTLGAATGVERATGAAVARATTGVGVVRGTGVARTVGTIRGGCAGAAVTPAVTGVGVGRGTSGPVVGSAEGTARGVGRDDGRLKPSRPGSGVTGAEVCAKAGTAISKAKTSERDKGVFFTRAAIAAIAQAPSHCRRSFRPPWRI